MRVINWRRIVLWVLIVACLILLWQVLAKFGEDLLFTGDSILFWAAGRLAWTGENPYAENLIIDVLRGAGHPANFGTEMPMPHMLYPPWALPVMLPFGLLSYPVFRLVWLAAHLALIALTGHLAWQMGGGQKGWLWLPLLLALTFAPAARVVSIGNPAPLMLIGVLPCIFLLQRPGSCRRWDFCAGMFAVLATLKPQLLYLYLVALGLWALHRRRWYFILGAGVGVVMATGLALAFNSQVVGQYIEAIGSHPVEEWATPTIGAVLRLVLGSALRAAVSRPSCRPGLAGLVLVA